MALANKDGETLGGDEHETFSWHTDTTGTVSIAATARKAYIDIYVMDKGEARHVGTGERFSYYPDLSSERTIQVTMTHAIAAGDYALLVRCTDHVDCTYSLKADWNG